MRLRSDEERVMMLASIFEHDEEAHAIEVAILSSDSLKTGTAIKLDAKTRGELITKIRGGEHHELHVTAITFRQKDGHPNRNGLRFKTGALDKIAASYVGMPVLRDHATWSTSARLGTIIASELVDLPGGWKAFRQTLHIVKSDAVISVLDGTLDMYSVGWRATGPVLCTAHKSDIRQRGSCLCWPLESVTVDGEAKLVEYEYQSADGIETSGVNVPAVKGTRNEDVRIALSAELGLTHRNSPQKENRMPWQKLATLLGLASIESDEGAVCAAVESRLTIEASWRERATSAEASVASLTTQLAAARSEGTKIQLDALIATAYSEGKLLATKDLAGVRVPDSQEAGLRSMGKDAVGVGYLKSFLESMPKKLAVLGAEQPGLNAGEPPKTVLATTASEETKTALSSVAEQLGVSVEAITANHAKISKGA